MIKKVFIINLRNNQFTKKIVYYKKIKIQFVWASRVKLILMIFVK